MYIWFYDMYNVYVCVGDMCVYQFLPHVMKTSPLSSNIFLDT